MKIAIISNLYKPYTRGGAEMLAHNTAKKYSQSNDVVVISTKPQKSLKNTIEDNIMVYRFRPKNIFYYLEDFKYPSYIRLIWRIIDVFNFDSYKKIKKILLQENPEVVITHNLVGIGYLIPKLIKKLGIKHIHTLHDVQLINPSGLKFDEKVSMVNKIYAKITKILFNSPDTVISPSEFLLNYYSKYKFFNKSKKQILKNPISQNIIVKESNKKKNTEFIQYLYIGQIEQHKGITNLVNAFKVWKNEKTKLTVIGKGSDLNKIKKIAKNIKNINILGFVENKKIPDYIQKTDFVIIPSLCYENSPNVIYESFAYATPILASKIGGIPELVTHENGFLFKPKQINDIIKAFDKSYKLSPKKYEEMSENALNKVKNLTLDNYLSKINLKT